MQKYEAIQKLSPIEFRRLIRHGQGICEVMEE